MKTTALTILFCVTLLTACEQSGEPSGTAGGDMNESATGAGDTASTAEELVDQAGVEIESAVESAKETAAELAADAKQQADAAIDAVQETAAAAAEKTAETVAAVTRSDAGKGESVYKSSCFACHGTGAAGAPKLGDSSAWTARIAQGNAVLAQHAIEGYKGATGYMPPKGGYSNLSDQDVTLAVEYMVSQVK